MVLPYHGHALRSRAFVAASLLLFVSTAITSGACSSSEGPGEPPVPPTPAQAEEAPPAAQAPRPVLECSKQPFTESLKLSEASAATLIPNAGLLVIADSGHRGDYQLLDPQAGTVLEKGKLPLPKNISDDIEGAATIGADLVALTSSGVVLEYARVKGGFEPKGTIYDVGAPIAGCSRLGSNCGMNWEGLCLGETNVPGLSGCLGAAVSKRRGTLVCIDRASDGALRINSKKSVDVAKRGVLSGCTIASGSVWVVSNALGANTIHNISATAHARFKPWVAASLEAVAAIGADGEGVGLVAFSDTNRGPSRAFRYQCNDPGATL